MSESTAPGAPRQALAGAAGVLYVADAAPSVRSGVCGAPAALAASGAENVAPAAACALTWGLPVAFVFAPAGAAVQRLAGASNAPPAAGCVPRAEPLRAGLGGESAGADASRDGATAAAHAPGAPTAAPAPASRAAAAAAPAGVGAAQARAAAPVASPAPGAVAAQVGTHPAHMPAVAPPKAAAAAAAVAQPGAQAAVVLRVPATAEAASACSGQLNHEFVIRDTPDGRGRGVYAKVLLLPNSVLTEYGGTRRSTRDIGLAANHTHMLHVPDTDMLVDAAPLAARLVKAAGQDWYEPVGGEQHAADLAAGFGALANSSVTARAANAKVVYLRSGCLSREAAQLAPRRAFLVLTRVVQPGEEILWRYHF